MNFSVREFPDATLTDEEENWVRLSFLLIDEGTIWVREGILTKHLNNKGHTLHDYLKSTKGMLERAHRGDARSRGKKLVRKLLSDEQFNTLFPDGNPASSANEFDLTLLIILLGWLKIVQEPNVNLGWSSTEWPDDTHTDLGSDLLRMRFMRNLLYAHIVECSMENGEFDKYWAKLQDILINLGADITKINDIKELKGSNEKRTRCIERITTLFTKDMEAAEKFAGEKMAELAKNHGSNMEERPTKIKMYMQYPDGSKHEM